MGAHGGGRYRESSTPVLVRTQAATVQMAYSLLLSCPLAAPSQFEVKSLPGWAGPLVSKAYCGFSSAGVPPSGQGSMFFNYIFLESENDPANDPVIVWYNGGPGAASMFGLQCQANRIAHLPVVHSCGTPLPPTAGRRHIHLFRRFVELGPYYLNQDSLDDPKYNLTGIPQVQRNPHRFSLVVLHTTRYPDPHFHAPQLDENCQRDCGEQPAADWVLVLRRGEWYQHGAGR